MVWNFGFLLMAMDRLRNEVADLAMMDDLTGVGNFAIMGLICAGIGIAVMMGATRLEAGLSAV